MATLDRKKTLDLFKRVYNNKMIEADAEKDIMGDAEAIKAICKKTFGDGGSTPSPEMLHSFNELVIETAEEVAKPLVSDLLSMLANTRTATRGNVVQINLPRKLRSKVIWSANGSDVDFIRVEGREKIMATPATFTTGYSYDPLDLVQDSVDTFREMVSDIAEAKLRLYMKQVASITETAVTNVDIPANNVISGSNTSITDYNSLVSRASRYGGRPLLIADPVMINDLAGKQPASTDLVKVISDQYKDELLIATNVTTIGRSTAMNLVNPFIDDENTMVELDVQKGYIVAGEGSQKPFTIVEYDGMRQANYASFEDDRVFIKIAQDASIQLVHTSNFFYIKDTALTL